MEISKIYLREFKKVLLQNVFEERKNLQEIGQHFMNRTIIQKYPNSLIVSGLVDRF